MTLSGKSILVTGGSLGIGLASAMECLRRGAIVTIAARNPATNLQALNQLRTEFPQSQVYVQDCDISEESEVAELLLAIAGRGPLHGVVHAAAIIGPIGAALEIDDAEWWQTVRVNLFGSFLVLKASALAMSKTGGGRIVAFSGGGASNPFPNYSAYAVGKVALVRLIETLAIEFQAVNVEVNALAPGFVATRMHSSTLSAGAALAGAEYYSRTIAELQNGGISPRVGARAAAFLVSENAKGINGKFVSAQWDDYEKWVNHLDELRETDIFTLRRILPKDRGMDWQ